jgi:hypothetical protein
MSESVMSEPFTVAPGHTKNVADEAALTARRFRDWLAHLDPEKVGSWGLVEEEREVVRLHVEPKALPSARPLPLRSFVITRSDEGDVIVGDPIGAAYGVGASTGEAFLQWEETARQHYLDLSEQADALHPRMLRQLQYLRRLFG